MNGMVLIRTCQGKPSLDDHFHHPDYRQQQIVVQAAKHCGSGIGSCPNNLCCSAYGYCGTSNEHCNVSQGCQPDYGLCYQDDDNNKPNKKVCGAGKGTCASGLCCSKYGYCGTSDDYCNVRKGCQVDYGLCYENDDQPPVSPEPTKRCGSGVGACPNNLCCSKQGYCGSTDAYCNIREGCQLNYGLCYDDSPDDGDGDDGDGDASPIQMCGPSFGSCANNLCCSATNECGKTDAHCNLRKGCQNAYGLCYEDDSTPKKECGSGYGRCSSGLCCSKDGQCGNTDAHCNVKQGCQVGYGFCYTPADAIREGSGRPCGKKDGSCEFPECCSKSGKCLLGRMECLESNECKPAYGTCLIQI